jgi:hypothetical protein
MSRVGEINRKVAEKITTVVSTMWAAYFFAALALISLPAAIKTGNTLVIIGWIAQTFLQLVLLSIIMVGQKRSSENLEKMIAETHAAALAEFELAKESRVVANQELVELRRITAEIHEVLKREAK